MDNVAIFVEDEAPDGEDLLGLYEGIPLTERTSSYAGAVMPDRISIYRRNILAICDTADDVRERGGDHGRARDRPPFRNRRPPAARARIRLTAGVLRAV